jgi:sulfur-oxidizing protein SoxY
VEGPFAPGPYVKSIRLFSETNPVPDMAVFEFPVPVERVEIESRIRLAGTQQVVAAAEMTDGSVYAMSTEVIVTLAGCMDGT